MPGFLNDTQIRELLDRGELIERGTWEVANVRHASYTLRLGARVEVQRASAAREAHRERQAIMLRSGGAELELQPGDTALLYSIENLRFPNDILGFTVARGLLFVETLAPENTYVDPGFSGHIYTTVTNLSGRVLKLPYGTPIARLFACRLEAAAAEPYRTGPAIGVEQHLESVPAIESTAPATQPVPTLLSIVSSTERSGPEIAELVRRIDRLALAAFVAALVWPIVIFVANSNKAILDSVGPILSNGLGGVLTVAILAALNKWHARARNV